MVSTILTGILWVFGVIVALMVGWKLLGFLWAFLCDISGIVFSLIVFVIVVILISAL